MKDGASDFLTRNIQLADDVIRGILAIVELDVDVMEAHGVTHVIWPITAAFVGLEAYAFHQIGEHNDDIDVLLPDHLPEEI